jgi:hypothetical protein
MRKATLIKKDQIPAYRAADASRREPAPKPKALAAAVGATAQAWANEKRAADDTASRGALGRARAALRLDD